MKGGRPGRPSLGRKNRCHPERPYGCNWLCKQCYAHQWYLSIKYTAKDHRAAWYRANKAHVLRHQKRARKQDPIGHALNTLRSTAKQRCMAFALTREDLEAVWTMICPVFGMPLSLTNTRKKDNSLSIDRIDNDYGYVPGNIAVMSWRANRLKLDASLEELEAVLKYVRRETRRRVA